MSLVGITLVCGLGYAQNKNIRIIEDQGKGVITLSCENLLTSACEVTIDIESSGLDLSKPTPITTRVPAGKTVLLVTLTPQPGQAWRYKYNTQYTQIIAADNPVAEEQESAEEIRPWDIPQTPAPRPPSSTPGEVEEIEKDEPPIRENDRISDPVRVIREETPPVERTETPQSEAEVEIQRETSPEYPVPYPPSVEERIPPKPTGRVNKTPGITLYTTPDCLKCDQAKLYLEGQGVKFKEVEITYPTSEVKAMYAQLLEQGYGGPIVAPVVAHSVNMYFDVPDFRSLLRELVSE
jgi:glutaredoxin